MKEKILPNKRKIHFIGIGGIGMSAIAKTLKHLGFEVSGSDQKEGVCFERMRVAGIRVNTGHDSVLSPDVDAVVYSTAINSKNPEMVQAEKLGIPRLHRSEILAEFLNKRPSIGVTGTHGKTTTSAMVSCLAKAAGWDPTCLVGGIILNHGDNVILGSDKLYIAEVDESDKSHSRYLPLHSIITNVEKEHLDHYKDFDEIKEHFKRYGFQTRPGGHLVINADDDELMNLFQHYPNSLITYGFSHNAEFWAHDIKLSSGGAEYVLYHEEQRIAPVKLNVPGLHNVSNSLGALALMITLGMSADLACKTMKDFKGTGRRLEIKLKTSDLLVVDDYAHHPTEIQASLRALKGYGKKVTAIFQPHRFSRIQSLLEEFGPSFFDADRIILTNIYGAGESNDQNISTEKVLRQIQDSGHRNVTFIERDKLLDILKPTQAPEGDLFAFMGAGDISEVADAFAVRFKS